MLRIFIVLYKNYSAELKTELGAWLNLVLLETLDNKNSSVLQKLDIIEALEIIFTSAHKLISLFYNYDNQNEYMKVYERLISILASIASSTASVSRLAHMLLTYCCYRG